VSADGQKPLPAGIYKALERPLFYTFIKFKFGAEAYNKDTGAHEPRTSERRRLFQYDDQGRLVCQKGFRPRLTGMLMQMGLQVEFIDKDDPKDPKIYQAHWDRVFDRFQFRSQQDVCLAQIDMHDYGLIDAPPAFGKTHIMGMIGVLYPKAKIDIVTKRKDVVARHKQLLTSWIPSVGQIGGGKKERNRRVTVYTADSLHHSDFTADFMLADEAHELMTDRLAEQVSRYWRSRNFAFTATPDTRMDNAHHRMEGIFGPTIFKMTQQQAEAHSLVAPVLVQWINVESDFDPALQSTLVAQKRNGIWRHEFRNELIARAAREHRAQDKQVLILVDTVDHALHIRKHLPEAKLCYAEGGLSTDKRRFFIREGLLEPGEVMTLPERNSLRHGFERREEMLVIATGVWAVGVSFDSLNVLIRADGGSSETVNVQLPGRVCRIDSSSGKQCGVLVDFYDDWNSNFRTKSVTRRRSYHKRGWTQFLSNGAIWAPRTRRGDL